MSERTEKNFSRLLKILLFVSVFCVAVLVVRRDREQEVISVKADKKELPVVVIDAGHGGIDPGKVGINGALEKDINLQIAGILKKFLEANDVKVVMTRESDEGLYNPDDSNKKVQDMKKRIALIEECEPVLVVSVHQNSYQEEYVKGAQVFYYTGSAEGQALAEKIQTGMVSLDKENKRQVKANDSYYLLKKTARPIVIVECGFLSNSQEAAKLVTPLYQEKLAWEIHLGVLQYMNEKEQNGNKVSHNSGNRE